MSRRRSRRARRRTRIPVAVVGTVLAVAVGGWFVLHDSTETEDRASTGPRAASTTTSSVTVVPVSPTTEPVVPTTTTAAVLAPGSPYPIEVVHTTLEDRSRPTGARGPTPSAPTRSLPVAVYVPDAPGRSPLVVFAHGFDVAAADYGALLGDLAAQGFVVVAPDFPLSSSAFPGPPTQADIDEQARDVAFLVDAFLDGAANGAWTGRIAEGEAGVVGHSDGGNTAARVASNSCCIDPRIGAAVVLAGDEGTSGGQWGVPGAAPMLLLQGTADSINPWAFSQRLYDDAATPKALVEISGGDHLAAFTSTPRHDPVVRLVAAYLRARLTGDTAALAQVDELANRDGLRLVASS